MCEKSDIKEILSVLVKAGLKNSPLTREKFSETLESFYDTLGDLPRETLFAAVNQYKSGATWFPTAGEIRNQAADLQMLVFGVPTAAEAWAEVLAPERAIPAAYCSEGDRLRRLSENANGDYWKIIAEYTKHRENCAECKDGGLKKIYSHPAVEKTVKRLGGIDAILTAVSMRAADRARFIDAYKEILAKEKKVAMMPASVRSYLEGVKRARLSNSVQSEIGLLTERMSV